MIVGAGKARTLSLIVAASQNGLEVQLRLLRGDMPTAMKTNVVAANDWATSNGSYFPAILYVYRPKLLPRPTYHGMANGRLMSHY